MTRPVLFLTGSLRAASTNARLARVAAAQLPEGYRATFYDLAAVPLYNADLDNAENEPAAVHDLRQHISEAAGVFWTTPEYNYALPGLVKNVIDWASRPLLPQSSLLGKPMNAAVATSSLTNGVRSLSDLKRYWGLVGGLCVPLPDCVVNLAPTKFVELDGAETLEPGSLKMVRLAVECLIRLIESGATVALEENWRAYITALTI